MTPFARQARNVAITVVDLAVLVGLAMVVPGWRTRGDMAYVHKRIRVGTTRSEAYASLRWRFLTAENAAAVTHAASEWPEQNLSLPPACAHPGVFLAYHPEFNLVCDSEINQYIWFDKRDRVDRIEDADASQTFLQTFRAGPVES